MAFFDYHKHEMNEAQRAIGAYENWKDSADRYAFTAQANAARCCPFLHSKNEPCRQLEPTCCDYYHPQGTPCPVYETASAAAAE